MSEYKALQQPVFYMYKWLSQSQAWLCILSSFRKTTKRMKHPLLVSHRFWKFLRGKRNSTLLQSPTDSSLSSKSYFSNVKFCTIRSEVMKLLTNFRTTQCQAPFSPNTELYSNYIQSTLNLEDWTLGLV